MWKACAVAATVSIAALGWVAPPAAAQEGDAIQITLREMLEKGLHARQPSDFEFIAKVVRRVDEGKLPRSLVEGTFLWAKYKGRYPFEYFQRGLKIRAAEIGVTL